MPKPKLEKPPFKGWKQFPMADGSLRWLPDWADKPLGFAVNPDEALRHGAFSKPPKVQALKKSVRAKSRR